jgi:hypothetical protein
VRSNLQSSGKYFDLNKVFDLRGQAIGNLFSLEAVLVLCASAASIAALVAGAVAVSSDAPQTAQRAGLACALGLALGVVLFVLVALRGACPP